MSTKTIRTSVTRYEHETLDYKRRIIAAGSTISDASLAKADRFVVDMKKAGLWDKLVEVSPFLGAGLGAALTKLKYASSGAFTNHNFAAGDFDEAAGLTGDGATKYLEPDLNLGAQLGNEQAFVGIYSGVDNSEEALGENVGVLIGNQISRLTFNGGADDHLLFTWGNGSLDAGEIAVGFYLAQADVPALAAYLNGEAAANNTAGNSDSSEAFAFLFAGNNGSDTPELFFPGVIGFYLVGTGVLTAEERQILANAVGRVR